MGKKLTLWRKSYCYLYPSEEVTMVCIMSFLRTQPHQQCGILDLLEGAQAVHKEQYHKKLYEVRFRWCLGLLLAKRTVKIWEIKRKRYIKIIAKKPRASQNSNATTSVSHDRQDHISSHGTSMTHETLRGKETKT